MTACLEGDEAAWCELWELYGPVVKAISRRTGCDADEARDVLQRVALAALQGLQRLREPERLAGWLAGTARYQSLEVIRKRRSSDPLYPGAAVHEPDPEGDVQRDRDLVVLRRAMTVLDQRCRRLIASLDLKEPPDSYRTVAEAEGLAPSSIGPIRRRCLERLGNLMGKMSQRPATAHFKGER